MRVLIPARTSPHPVRYPEKDAASFVKMQEKKNFLHFLFSETGK